MDNHQQHKCTEMEMMAQRKQLETIQEEEETDEQDETEGSEHQEGDEEEEGLETEVDAETEDVVEEGEENGEDIDAPLRVLRPRRLSGFPDQGGSSQMRPPFTEQREMEESLSVWDLSFSGEDLRREASTPGRTQPRQAVQKKKGRTRHKKEPPAEEPFPNWLVDLMFNIEEATTHELVIE